MAGVSHRMRRRSSSSSADFAAVSSIRTLRAAAPVGSGIILVETMVSTPWETALARTEKPPLPPLRATS